MANILVGGLENKEDFKSRKLIDMTGHKLGKWTVKKRLPSQVLNCGATGAFWLVECTCGSEFPMAAVSLRKRSTAPEGCIFCKNLVGTNLRSN